MKLKPILRVLITVLLLGLILGSVDLSALLSTLMSIPAWVAILVVGGYLLGQVISAGKWWLIAKAGDIDVSYPKALKAYFIGMFANFFGLGLVGGDLARAMLLSKGQTHKTPAFASVVADRAHGLGTLALIGVVAALCFGRASIDTQLLLLIGAIGFGIVAFWFLGPATLLAILPKSFPFRSKIEQTLQVFPKSLGSVTLLTLISVAFHILQIGLHFAIALSFGSEVSFAYLLMAIPIVNILSSLPISWNGLGVRENGYMFFLAPTYLSAEQAFAMGAIWLLAVTTSSLVGGLIALFTNEIPTLLKRPLESKPTSETSTPSNPTSAQQKESFDKVLNA